MKEIWKDIAGYEGLYQVSNLGRVKSLDRKIKHARFGEVNRKGKELKRFVDDDGYLRVGLFNGDNKKTRLVHRLVAEAFIENPENKKTVNHINGIKTDNCVDNLEWNTHEENIKHSHKTGLNGSKNHLNQRSSKKVMQIDKNMSIVKIHPSIGEAARAGFDRRGITKCCKGKQQTAGGYYWKLA